MTHNYVNSMYRKKDTVKEDNVTQLYRNPEHGCKANS